MQFRGHLPAVDVFVNEQGPFLFAIDTGAQGLARADASLVKKLNLGVVGQVNVSATRTMDLVELDSIRVGDVIFSTGLPAPSRDYNKNFPTSCGHVDGILGYNLFAD